MAFCYQILSNSFIRAFSRYAIITQHTNKTKTCSRLFCHKLQDTNDKWRLADTQCYASRRNTHTFPCTENILYYISYTQSIICVRTRISPLVYLQYIAVLWITEHQRRLKRIRLQILWNYHLSTNTRHIKNRPAKPTAFSITLEPAEWGFTFATKSKSCTQ